MERITIRLDNVAPIARSLLLLHPSLFSNEQLPRWLDNKQRLQEALDQFLNPKTCVPGENFIDYMDRSLRELVICVRHMLTQLPDQARQALPVVNS